MCHIHTETPNVRYKINSIEMSLEAATVHCSGVQGNRTPGQPSHLTGFLHTLGSVFEFSHQILKKKKKTAHFFSNQEKIIEDEGDVEKYQHLTKSVEKGSSNPIFFFFLDFNGKVVFLAIFSALDCYGIKSFWIFLFESTLISMQCVTQVKPHGFF